MIKNVLDPYLRSIARELEDFSEDNGMISACNAEKALENQHEWSLWIKKTVEEKENDKNWPISSFKWLSKL